MPANLHHKSMLILLLLGLALGLNLSMSPILAQSGTVGVQIAMPGTERAYFTHNGQPLLSFGTMSDRTFYAGDDSFNYRQWADWGAAHGMNHIRAYPPLSWRHQLDFARLNGGSANNVLFPYEETSPGSRQFDLTRFNAAYWARFRSQLEYFQSKGIIVHLLMWNGWQLRDNPIDWPGHYFNPANNVNAFTDSLGGAMSNRLKLYHSIADQNAALAEAQRNWFRKLVEVTHDLDNVYYDLLHELAEHYTDWPRTQPWVEDMALTIRNYWQQLEPSKPIVLGMDTGGLEGAIQDWIFTRPYFDVLIYGKVHTTANAVNWRRQYKKPYIPQESWDDNGMKYTYRAPEERVQTRKYLWKFMMTKSQQLDLYNFAVSGAQPPGYEHNYNPNGWNPFENDAIVLRQFWNGGQDYPNLWFDGTVTSGPGSFRMVLSSSRQAWVYLSSATGQQNVSYSAQRLQLSGLALANGSYAAQIVKPDSGVIGSQTINVSGGQAAVDLPAFVDDLAVNLVTSGTSPTATFTSVPATLTPTPTATQTATQTMTWTPTHTPTLVPTATWTPTATETAVPTSTETPTALPTASPTETEPTPTTEPPTPTPDTPSPGTAVLHISANPANAPPGAQVVVGLAVSNVAGLYGLEVRCVVDPLILTGQAVSGGEGLNTENSYFVNPGFNAADGSWTVAASRLRPHQPISGSAALFSLNFLVQGEGGTDIICTALAADINGRAIPLDVETSRFDTAPAPTPVEASPTATTEPPTPTPTETLVPSPVPPTTEPGFSTISGGAAYQSAPDNAGITIELRSVEQVPLASVTTNASGAYVFTDVPLGVYVLFISAPRHLSLSQMVLVETVNQTIDTGTSTLLAGDTDSNQVIDLADASLIGASYGLSVPPASDNADLNRDAKVDISDLVLTAGNLNLTGPVTNP